MRIWKVLTFGVGAFLATMILIGHTAPATAAYRRVHASQCHYSNDNAGVDDFGTSLYNGYYLSNNRTARGIWCTAPSDSELPHAATVYLNVHGYAPANTAPYSMACAKAYNALAYTCGPLKYWGTGYNGVYTVSVSAWTANAGAFPVVYTYMPPLAQLYGFYMAN